MYMRNSSTITGFLQCNGGKLEEAEDSNVFSSFIAYSNRNRSALARSWFYLLYNWPPNNELLLNNSLLELIYFLKRWYQYKRAYVLSKGQNSFVIDKQTSKQAGRQTDIFCCSSAPSSQHCIHVGEVSSDLSVNCLQNELSCRIWYKRLKNIKQIEIA